MDFYEASTLEESEKKLQLGNILYPVPFVGFSVTEAVVLTPDAEEPITVNLTEITELQAETQLLTSIGISHGMVLNQSCDLSDQPGRRKPILVARVLPSEDRVKDLKPDSTLKRRVGAIKALANPGKSRQYSTFQSTKTLTSVCQNALWIFWKPRAFRPANLTH